MMVRQPQGRGDLLAGQLQLRHINRQKNCAASLAEVIDSLRIVERFHSSDLVVLTPRRLNESSLIGLHSGSFRLIAEGDSPKPGDILLTSIAGFKGLERPVVIVAELDERLTKSDRFTELCYVGFSREESSHSSGRVSGPFQAHGKPSE